MKRVDGMKRIGRFFPESKRRLHSGVLWSEINVFLVVLWQTEQFGDDLFHVFLKK